MSDSLGFITKVAETIIPGVGSILGISTPDAPNMPLAIDKPGSMATGQQVAEKGGSTLDEEELAKKNARKTARKGTSQFRIPLASTASGIKASGGSGLKI